MFLCYVDESGYNGSKLNSAQPVQVMVGIFPNVYNFHRSDSEFREVFELLRDEIPLSEVKGEQIYRGRGPWRDVKPEIRDNVIEYYLDWVTNRNHKLIVTAIDNIKYFELREAASDSPFIQALPYPYLLAGLHIALAIQKLNRGKKKNKGKTILIFDEQEEFSNTLTELIFSPPEFIDDFVPFDPAKEGTRLNQIIDTAFFVRSHHSSMAQVVDVVAYLYRLHLELTSYGFDESYEGEARKVAAWIERIRGKFVPFNKIYPRRKAPFLDFINEVKAKGI